MEVPTRLAELAQTCLTVAQGIDDAWATALTELQVPSGSAGNSLGGSPLLTAHTDAANAAAIAVDRLVAVLEADVDAVYLCAFDFSATDERAATGLEQDKPEPTPSPTPSPTPGPPVPSPTPGPAPTPSPSPGPAPTPTPTARVA